MQLQWDKLIINNEVFVFCEDTGQVLPEIADIPVNIFHCEKIFFTHANVRVHLPRVPEDGGRLRGGSEARARQCPAPGPRRPASASSPGERRSRPARSRALGWSLTRSSQTPPPTFKHATVLHNSNCKPLEQKMYNKVLSLAMVDGVSVVVWRGCRPELGSLGWCIVYHGGWTSGGYTGVGCRDISAGVIPHSAAGGDMALHSGYSIHYITSIHSYTM